MTHVMEVLYRNDKLFHIGLKVLKITTAVLAKVTFNDLHTLRTKLNGHDEDLDIMDGTIQNFVTGTNNKFHKMKMTLNNHHL